MKALVTLLLCGALLTWFAVCNKESNQGDKDSGTESKWALVQAVDDIKSAAGRFGQEVKASVESVRESAERTFTEAKEKAASTAATATARAQELIDKARSLISKQKFQDALSVIRELGNYQLTPEQQRIVVSLKATIQSAMASLSEGASVVRNFLGRSNE